MTTPGRERMVNYFEVLHIEETAKTSEIKKAYRTLAKQYHPDVSNFSKSEAERMMQVINEAYQTLSDEGKRQQYIRALHLDPEYKMGKKESTSFGCKANEPKNRQENEKTAAGSPPTNAPAEEEGEEPTDPLSRAISIVIVAAVVVSILCCIIYFAPAVLRDTVYIVQRNIQKIISSFM